MIGGLAVTGNERRAFDQIARRITADGKFRKQNQPRACGLSAAGEIDDLGRIAREVSYGWIDLAERDLHTSSVKGDARTAKSVRVQATLLCAGTYLL